MRGSRRLKRRYRPQRCEGPGIDPPVGEERSQSLITPTTVSGSLLWALMSWPAISERNCWYRYCSRSTTTQFLSPEFRAMPRKRPSSKGMLNRGNRLGRLNWVREMSWYPKRHSSIMRAIFVNLTSAVLVAISEFPKWRKYLISLSFRGQSSVRPVQVGGFDVNIDIHRSTAVRGRGGPARHHAWPPYLGAILAHTDGPCGS